jgi:hypothetical protein
MRKVRTAFIYPDRHSEENSESKLARSNISKEMFTLTLPCP